LTRHKTVQAFAIFIGSIGNEALKLKQSLPAGHAHVCQSTQQLPSTILSILTSQIIFN